MRLKVPFTDRYLILGKKAVEAAKQSIIYGSWQNTLQQMFTGSGYRVGFDTLYTIYNNVVDVKQAIRRIQNAVCKAGYRFVARDDDKKDGDAQQAAIAKSLMDTKELPFSKLKDLWVRNLGITGNAFWFLMKSKGGQWLGLQDVDPRTMCIKADKYGNVMGYVQRNLVEDIVDFSPEEIAHSVMDYSTTNPLLGVSPIESFVWEARTELAAQMSNYYFYENNAVPAHLMIIDENLNADQVKDLKRDVEENFKGAQKMWKAGIIPFVKDIKTITPSQKDMQFIESRKFTTKKVVVAYGVDSFLLGYTEGVQRSNAYVIRQEFYDNTCRPYENYIEEVFNNHILPTWGLDRIKLKVNVSSYDDIEQLENRSRNDVTAGIITINEARHVRKMPPADNELADELLINGQPLNDFAAQMQAVTAAVKEKMLEQRKKAFNLLDDGVI